MFEDEQIKTDPDNRAKRAGRKRKLSEDDGSEKFKKLFVGGLRYETTDETLRSYFEEWGEVTDCVVLKDPHTKRSRGFGFVTFREAKMLDECQECRPHTIDGREVDTKRALPRLTGERLAVPDSKEPTQKLFVGGIRDITTTENIKRAFEQFGKVTMVELMMDKETGRHRGFAFVTFDDTDSADKAVIKKHLEVDEKMVEIKKAESKQSVKHKMGMSMGMNNMGMGGNMGMNNMGMNMGNNMGMNNMGMANNMGMGMNNMGMNNMGMNNMGMNMGMNNMGMNNMGNMGMNNMGMNNMGNMGMNNMGMNNMGMNAMGMNNMGMNSMGMNAMGNMGMNNMGMGGNMGNTSGNMSGKKDGSNISNNSTDKSITSANNQSTGNNQMGSGNQMGMGGQMGMMGNQMGMMGNQMGMMSNQMGMMGNQGGMMGNMGNNPMGNNQMNQMMMANQMGMMQNNSMMGMMGNQMGYQGQMGNQGQMGGYGQMGNQGQMSNQNQMSSQGQMSGQGQMGNQSNMLPSTQSGYGASSTAVSDKTNTSYGGTGQSSYNTGSQGIYGSQSAGNTHSGWGQGVGSRPVQRENQSSRNMQPYSKGAQR